MFRICGCLLVLLFWPENRSFPAVQPAFFTVNRGNFARIDLKTTPYPRALKKW
jgi:hypothetical protein